MSTAPSSLLNRRCSNHPAREASARCPECRLYYCRECITEHDDRVLCATCLAKIGLKQEKAQRGWEWAPRLALALVMFLALYLAFALLGRGLLSVPSTFHPRGGW
jgi:hypothetical protein